MGQYKVPQNVETEDKILGPLSVKQFIYVIIALMWAFLMWRILSLIHIQMCIRDRQKIDLIDIYYFGSVFCCKSTSLIKQCIYQTYYRSSRQSQYQANYSIGNSFLSFCCTVRVAGRRYVLYTTNYYKYYRESANKSHQHKCSVFQQLLHTSKASYVYAFK